MCWSRRARRPAATARHARRCRWCRRSSIWRAANPVLAAGGIADGRGLAAALTLGAAGVVCGTAFYASVEGIAHPNAKKAVVAASGDDTERGTSVDVVRGMDWPAEWNIRTLRNSFTEKWSRDPAGLQANLERERPRFLAAREAGDTDCGAADRR